MSIVAELSSRLAPLFGAFPYTVRHGVARGLKRRGGLGFPARPEPSSAEERFLCSLKLTGQTVYDIGGYQGLFSMFFARAVGPTGRVVCFEPITPDIIRRNLALNGFNHAEVRAVAPGATTFITPHGQTGSTSGCAELQDRYSRDRHKAHTVGVSTLDIEATTLPPPDFVKIDVEGMELDVLRGAVTTLQTHHPRLFVEIHGVDADAWSAREREVAAFLQEIGYVVRHADGMHLDAVPR